MSWMEKMKEYGGADVAFLSEDGEMTTIVIVADPVLIEGKYLKKDTKRVGVPCVSIEGFQLLIVGMRVGRRLAKKEQHHPVWAFEIIRHGEPGETSARYEINRTKDAELEKKLLKDAEGLDYEEDLVEAIEAAQEIAKG